MDYVPSLILHEGGLFLNTIDDNIHIYDNIINDIAEGCSREAGSSN
jgi:hypothetical protein